jgi:hypothetical protein
VNAISRSITVAALTSLVAACGGSDNADIRTVLAVYGDVPYGTSPTDDSQLKAHPAFIDAINKDTSLSMVAHIGDIHSGKEYCTDAYNKTILSQWTAFKLPLVYMPGDNEWADCHKVKQGGGVYNANTLAIDYVANGSYEKGDPLKNLALVRSTFFPTAGKTLGTGTVQVHSQATEFDPANPADASYVENVWWRQSGVIIVAINVPGGSNNNADIWYGTPTMSTAQTQEIANRTAANIRWLNTAFATAKSTNALGVVILLQADMWDMDTNSTLVNGQNHIYGYKPFIDEIAAKTTDLGKPVLLMTGDSHYYRVDNPLKKGSPCVIEPTANAAAVACNSTAASSYMNTVQFGKTDAYDNQPFGYNVPNLVRIVWHGSTLGLEYVKLTIDPNANAAVSDTAFGPFSWERVKP